MNKVFVYIATFFGIGYLPASGTCASICATLLLIGMQPSLPLYYALLLIIAVVGGFAVQQTLNHKTFKSSDPSQIVIDEVLGILVTFLWVPITWGYFLSGLLLFRLFDITKPFGIKKLESIKGASGIMLDDIAAGLLANISVRLISWYINK